MIWPRKYLVPTYYRIIIWLYNLKNEPNEIFFHVNVKKFIEILSRNTINLPNLIEKFECVNIFAQFSIT